MNYKVCTKLTIFDGLNSKAGSIHSYTTEYQYAKGYAFSSFIKGKKETDFFGFGEFTVIDPLNSKSVTKYHNIPCDDFRLNRALAGAKKESITSGWDYETLREYIRTEYKYKIHKIVPVTNPEVSSYLIEPVEVKKYINKTLTETNKSKIELGAENFVSDKNGVEIVQSSEYEMNS